METEVTVPQGWRHAQTRPSLAEVYKTVAVP